MDETQEIKPFYLEIQDLKKENRGLIRKIGEQAVAIARLQERLQKIEASPDKSVQEIESIAPKAPQETEKKKQIRFKPNNHVKYQQDFSGWIGVPSNVVFEIEYINEKQATLSAPGYGGIPYGNGIIIIFRSMNVDVLEDIAGLWGENHQGRKIDESPDHENAGGGREMIKLTELDGLNPELQAKIAALQIKLSVSEAENEQLRAEVERLREALGRFADRSLLDPIGDGIAMDILNARAVLEGHHE